MVWSILAAELDPGQQCAAILEQLEGSARTIVAAWNWQEITQGRVHNGQQLDPVSLLLLRLAEYYAPHGEERRINAMNELAAFRRQPFESKDAKVARFRNRIHRCMQAGGLHLQWEGYAWLLLRACGVTDQQLLDILQTTQGRYPQTQAEFEQMVIDIRRRAHILEGAQAAEQWHSTRPRAISPPP